jgi:protein-histidine pros-kinase
MLWPFIPRALALPSVQEMADLTGHLQIVREDEKRIIARRLHDELITTLTVASMDLHNVRTQLEAEHNSLARNVEMVIRLLEGSIDVKRNMVESLRPPMLHELGIGAALRQLAERFSARTGIAHRLAVDADAAGAVSEDLGIALYRVAQECLDNVARHARATSVELALGRRGADIEMTIRDDGQGIALAAMEKQGGYGLRGSRQMLARWHGTLTASRGPERGTVMRATARLPG